MFAFQTFHIILNLVHHVFLCLLLGWQINNIIDRCYHKPPVDELLFDPVWLKTDADEPLM